MYPEDLKYRSSHEWVRVEGEMATIGLSEFALKQLSDLVFIDLPDVGTKVSRDETFGEIESVKAVSDLFSPLSGEITEINSTVADNPESISQDPYGNGWLIKIKISEVSEVEALLDAVAYKQITEEADH
jgi:glycine cleavage system H protein